MYCSKSNFQISNQAVYMPFFNLQISIHMRNPCPPKQKSLELKRITAKLPFYLHFDSEKNNLTFNLKFFSIYFLSNLKNKFRLKVFRILFLNSSQFLLFYIYLTLEACFFFNKRCVFQFVRNWSKWSGEKSWKVYRWQTARKTTERRTRRNKKAHQSFQFR